VLLVVLIYKNLKLGKEGEEEEETVVYRWVYIALAGHVSLTGRP
jgi:hypothetical protein